jgi:Tfp pilus assembly protein PilN
MPVDLKKEIKLSDLFKRRAKDSDAAPETEKPPKPVKERRPLFGRRGKREEEPSGTAATASPAHALPAIPLMRPFNLLPAEEAEHKGRTVGFLQVAVALGGIIVLAALGGLYLFSSASATDKRGTVDELRVELARVSVPKKQAGADSRAQLASEQKSRADALTQALENRVPLDRLLRDFGLVLPDDVWLDALQVTTPGASVTTTAEPAAPVAPPGPGATTAAPTAFLITGYTRKQTGVAELLSRLSVLPELTSVTLLSASAADDPTDTTVQFSISAALRDEGAS